MYAIIATGGKQLLVREQQVIFVEKLAIPVGNEYTFTEVLLVSNQEQVQVGTPVLQGVTVTAKVLAQAKAPKITVFKYKPKKGSTRKKQGHRQPFTKLIIEKINLG